MCRKDARSIIAYFLVLLTPIFCSDFTHSGELEELTDTAPFDFHLTDLAGQQHNLDKFRGNVVLINFWANWCTPCIQEMPSTRRLAAAMRAYPFEVVAINVGEGERRVRTATQRLAPDFLVLLDRDSAVFNRWGAGVLPTTYILDA